MIRTIKTAGMALAATLAIAGCSSNAASKAEDLAERACACETTECAEAVNAELQEFLREAPGKRLSDGDQERLREAASRIGGCLDEQRGAGAVTGDSPGHDHDHDHDH